ncbi:CidA/LrgA family protein [Paraburkholderia diazotrophica]|uniref:CidA/LrgA family protein n=1 Tax=Paraburkholderia diazotrophica TaxID=667676 RepID=UPI003175BA60
MNLSLLNTRPNAVVRGDVSVVCTFATLIAFQGIGELLARILRVPIPGPVIGMVLLTALLATAPSVGPRLEKPALGFLNHLSLLFIPAGVGVVGLSGALNGQLIAILLAIVVSTALSVAVTGIVTCALLQRHKRVKRSAAPSAEAQH